MDSASKIDHHVVLFDGVCNLCNGAVNFILDQNPNKDLKFAALQSEVGKELVKDLSNIPDSIVFYSRGKVFYKSQAVLEISRYLRSPWRYAQVLKIIPTFLSDWIYDLIAKYRYRLFGRRDACRVPTPELKDRFLDSSYVG